MSGSVHRDSGEGAQRAWIISIELKTIGGAGGGPTDRDDRLGPIIVDASYGIIGALASEWIADAAGNIEVGVCAVEIEFGIVHVTPDDVDDPAVYDAWVKADRIGIRRPGARRRGSAGIERIEMVVTGAGSRYGNGVGRASRCNEWGIAGAEVSPRVYRVAVSAVAGTTWGRSTLGESGDVRGEKGNKK